MALPGTEQLQGLFSGIQGIGADKIALYEGVALAFLLFLLYSNKKWMWFFLQMKMKKGKGYSIEQVFMKNSTVKAAFVSDKGEVLSLTGPSAMQKLGSLSKKDFFKQFNLDDVKKEAIHHSDADTGIPWHVAREGDAATMNVLGLGKEEAVPKKNYNEALQAYGLWVYNYAKREAQKQQDSFLLYILIGGFGITIWTLFQVKSFLEEKMGGIVSGAVADGVKAALKAGSGIG